MLLSEHAKWTCHTFSFEWTDCLGRNPPAAESHGIRHCRSSGLERSEKHDAASTIIHFLFQVICGTRLTIIDIVFLEYLLLKSFQLEHQVHRYSKNCTASFGIWSMWRSVNYKWWLHWVSIRWRSQKNHRNFTPFCDPVGPFSFRTTSNCTLLLLIFNENKHFADFGRPVNEKWPVSGLRWPLPGLRGPIQDLREPI